VPIGLFNSSPEAVTEFSNMVFDLREAMILPNNNILRSESYIITLIERLKKEYHLE
jgi:hypothetical protein